MFAYLDPGSGSLLIQAMIAGALAVPFLLRAQFRAVVERLRHRTAPDADAAPADDSPH